MEQYGYVEGVFHASVGRYTLTFHDAQRLCALLGATLATYDQLYTAWEAGLQKCTYVLLYSSIIVFIYVSFCFFASRLFMFEVKNVSSFLKEQVVS